MSHKSKGEKVRVTINEVAQKANVSKTTVSRYLNGKYEYMSEETKELLANVIDQLDYRPSNLARSLKAKNSGVIGCIIADIGSPFSSIVLKGVSDYCKQLGYSVLFANIDNDPINEKESIQSLLDNKVDGLIINTTGKNDDYLLSLKNEGIKIVLADRSLSTPNVLDTVATNNYDATYDLVKHLSEQGYKRVAFFTQDMSVISSRYKRHEGFNDAMRKYFNQDGNLTTYVINIDDPQNSDESLREFVNVSKGEPAAIFTVNGVTLLTVLHGMKRLNIEISPQMGICGFDDWGWASLIPPGITTLTQESYECGVQSAKLLIERIKEQEEFEPKYIELPAQLVKRGSTNPKLLMEAYKIE
ncbi:LacI family DNA-binding transcriptional regulator [Neobacillus notoginsengisoli]|uniref:LacI family DNA-binding transcriptional regulator n=1 Tax=Neobacillus notoginsengisoli TaxID=1578198 RepID=A0A417YSW2_9BACI|nr:LacI family DNA-binding transcriptional regulator [Neobacillus notoginsengisoli]RHW39098.1 LacI family DNA-binding transcriptional regulator [Neobacillus notoginsengisoli]